MRKKSPEKHIEEIGEKKYWLAHDHAMMVIRLNAPKLVGLSKIRDAMAKEAALRATGFGDRPFTLPKSCGEPNGDIYTIIEAIMPAAIEAARAAVSRDR
jgi:hypothetical protein